MASAVGLRADYSAAELRRLAASTRNANQSRRLLSLAAVLDGMNRTEAARIGGMDRQTLRDWVHRFNGHGPEGLLDSWSKGPEPRLSHDQRVEIARTRCNGAGPGPARCGALASDRPAARHSRAVRDRLSRTYNRQAPQGAWLLSYECSPASPGPGSAHDRGV